MDLKYLIEEFDKTNGKREGFLSIEDVAPIFKDLDIPYEVIAYTSELLEDSLVEKAVLLFMIDKDIYHYNLTRDYEDYYEFYTEEVPEIITTSELQNLYNEYRNAAELINKKMELWTNPNELNKLKTSYQLKSFYKSS